MKPSRRTKKRTRGNCYVCVEALYHLMGGKESGWVPHVMRHEGDTHWFLAKRIVPFGLDRKFKGIPGPVFEPIRIILDPTVAQFKKRPDYSKARATGFLTKKPSKRAQEMMQKMLWQEVSYP